MDQDKLLVHLDFLGQPVQSGVTDHYYLRSSEELSQKTEGKDFGVVDVSLTEGEHCLSGSHCPQRDLVIGQNLLGVSIPVVNRGFIMNIVQG